MLPPVLPPTSLEFKDAFWSAVVALQGTVDRKNGVDPFLLALRSGDVPARKAAAERLGITVQNGRLAPADLVGVKLPSDQVILLKVRDSGYALLKQVVGARFLVADSVRGVVAYTADEMETFWSGDAILVTRSGPCQVRLPAWERFVLAVRGLVVFSASWRLAGPWARWGSIILPLLLVATYVSHGSDIVGIASVALALLMASTLVGYTLVKIHGGSSLALRYCSTTGPSGCSDLLNSRHSRVGPFSWAGLGFSAHLASAALLCIAGPGALPTVLVCLVPGVAAAIRLFVLQLREGKFCRLCNAVHILNLAVVMVAALTFRESFLLESSLRLLPLFLLLFSTALLVAVPQIQDADKLSLLEAEKQYMLSTPWARNALIEQAPRISDIPAGVALSKGSGQRRAVLVLGLGCGTCKQVIAEILRAEELLERFRVEVVLIPHLEEKFLAESAPALMSVGLLRGARVMLEAYEQKAHEGSAKNPLESLAKSLGLPIEELRAASETASQMVRQAVLRTDRDIKMIPWAVFGDRMVSADNVLSVITHFPELMDHPLLSGPLDTSTKPEASTTFVPPAPSEPLEVRP
jgi:hypothetical protein